MELNAVVLASLCLVAFTKGAAIDETAMLGKRLGPGEESSLLSNLLTKLFETVEEKIEDVNNSKSEVYPTFQAKLCLSYILLIC